MKAIFGWGRPLYDENLARLILQRKAGISDPSIETVRHFAKHLRRKTLQVRIFSLVTAILLIIVIVKGVIR
jgi:hypothetical protein